MAESFASLRPLMPGATSSRTSELSDPAASLLELVSRRQYPARRAGWESVVGALTERAEGSPHAIEGLVSDDLTQMARQIMQANGQISRTFGPYGGKQLPAAMGQARAGLNIPGLYANAALNSGQQLNKFISGTSIMAPQGQKTTGIAQEPMDIAQIARAWQGLLSAGAGVYGGIRNMTAPGPTSGTLPTTWDAYNAGNYANTTYQPFGQAPTMRSFGPSGALPYL